jgi:uncharacterized protein
VVAAAEADGTFRCGLGSLVGTRELLTPRTLALSAAMRFDEPEVQPFGRAIAEIRELGVRQREYIASDPGVRYAGLFGTVRLLDERRASAQPFRFDDPEIVFPNPRDSALTLLRFADLGLGIDNVQVI